MKEQEPVLGSRHTEDIFCRAFCLIQYDRVFFIVKVVFRNEVVSVALLQQSSAVCMWL